MTNSNSTSDERVTTILPSDFSNDMFAQNMAYLKSNQPALYKIIQKHKCKEYWLCSNPDGSPNIVHIPSKAPVYFASTMEEIMAPIQKQIDNLFCYVHLHKFFFGEGDDWWKNSNPIQIKVLDNLYKAGIFSELKLSSKTLAPLRSYCTDYLPLVRVYGIGLGYHLTELITQKKISYMTIYEPNFDLFYTSLYTIPWNLIFKYFEFNNKGLNLVLDTTPDEAIDSNQTFIETRLTPLTSLFYRFNHFNSLPIIQTLIEKEPFYDNLHRSSMDAGWYEDQRSGFYFSARNIKKGNQFFSGKRVKRYFRAFVIGSGPSLNESIDYIKSHQDDALIMACGSSIHPLLKSGIVPDYVIVQERTWHILKIEEKYDPHTLKGISLLKLNVVSPKIDAFYKETLIFQKYRDPGSSILQGSYPVTKEVNPTVTNAGIAFAAELGANEVYLFGVDYGVPKGSKKMHAINSLQEDMGEDDSVEAQEHDRQLLPGNFGETIHSTHILSWSRNVAEIRIAKHQSIKWFNVGEGASIAGTSPIAVESLPANFKRKIQKHHLCKEISNCFDNSYSIDETLTRLETHHMKEIKDYLQEMLGFTNSNPQSREEITSTLSLMYKAALVGEEQTDFLPTTLLSGGIKQVINNIYIQAGLAADDESAVRFFSKAKNIFREHIHDIEEDLHKVLGYIKDEEEFEIKK